MQAGGRGVVVNLAMGAHMAMCSNVLPWDLGICVYIGPVRVWSPDKTAGCTLPFPGQRVSVIGACAGHLHKQGKKF